MAKRCKYNNSWLECKLLKDHKGLHVDFRRLHHDCSSKDYDEFICFSDHTIGCNWGTEEINYATDLGIVALHEYTDSFESFYFDEYENKIGSYESFNKEILEVLKNINNQLIDIKALILMDKDFEVK